MADALQSMLARADAAILIGTDCPDLSVGLLVEAFEALRTSDVVIGPAFDGGYYLIGLRRQAPALFEGVAWGTSEVLAATLARAASLGLVVHKLPTLSDVDEPGDLAVWERVKAGCQTVGVPPELSIVIPTLDEAAEIAGLLRRLRQPGVELIVADGGSCDRTREIAAACGARVVRASPGRGTQMNAGSAVARGGVLLFLHADTSLPDDFIELIREALSDPSVAVGAFRFAIERAGVTSRLLESAVRLRCKLLRLPYGDQAYFMSRETFDRLGGFAEIPLMEDVDLVRRARRLGRVVVLDAAATTSARRWERAGLLRTTAVNQACLVGYALGVSPQRLARWRRGLSG